MDKQIKTNTRVLTLLVGTLFIVGSLMAQPPQNRKRPPKMPDSAQIEKMVDEMATNLSLTDKQKSTILDLHIAHFSVAKGMMEEQKGDRENHRQEMDALRNEFHEQVEDQLTDDQKKDYKKFLENHKPKHGQQRPKRR